VRAIFEDGSDATGEVLIGADGIHSAVRRLIDPNAPAPTYVGLVNLGGYARGVPVEAEPGSYTLIFGKRAFFGYLPAPDGEVWWFANVPRGDEPARARPKRSPSRMATPAGRAVCRGRRGRGPVWWRPATPPTSRTPVPSTPSRTCRSGTAAPWSSSGTRPTPPPRPPGRRPRWPSKTPSCWPSAFATCPTHSTHSPASRPCVPRVERIIKVATRINSSKAPGPVARVFRGGVLPVVLSSPPTSKQVNQQYRYHMDWDTPVTSTTA
jgi:FAD-dependent urate hydroxylase